MDKKFIQNAFTIDAAAWLVDGYKYEGYNYPVALQRLRIVLDKVTERGANLRIADLGCGGGDVAFCLARAGHTVDGVDQSSSMIDAALKRLRNEEQCVQGRIKFSCQDLESTDLPRNVYDVVLSMGVIGYLESDETLFRQAKYMLKPGGLFLVSTRNRLFNISSISHRTINEIEQQNIKCLVEEFNEIDTTVPIELSCKVVERFKQTALSFPDLFYESDFNYDLPSKRQNLSYESVDILEPRQHTPNELDAVADGFGFRCVNHCGVHPHLINPKLNKSLPPAIFNKLSDCLEPLEELPISLTWSSVFIGVYQLN